MGFMKFRLVEVKGFEPTTSSLRTRRSSQLSYTPNRDHRNFDTLLSWLIPVNFSLMFAQL